MTSPNGNDVSLQAPAAPWRLYGSIGVITLLVGVTVAFTIRTADGMVARYTPLTQAAMGIKLEACTGHLWLEEAIYGDRHEDIETVWDHLDNATRSAQDMLNGAEYPKTTILPLRDAKLRNEIEQTLVKLGEFRQIAEERIARGVEAVAGSEIDQRFDAVFLGLVRQADVVEHSLRQATWHDLRRFRLAQGALIVITVLLGFGTVTLVHRYDRRRAADFVNVQHARQRVEVERRRLAATMMSMGDGLILTDAKGTIEFINPVAVEITGVPAADAVGQPIGAVVKIVDEQTDKLLENPIELVLREREPSEIARRHAMVSRSGRRIPITESSTTILDDAGDLLGAAFVVHDMSEFRRSEEALRASEQRFRAITENTSDVTAILDGDGLYRYISPSILRVAGYNVVHMLGKTIDWLVHPDDRRVVAQALAKAASDLEVTSSLSEIRVHHVEGHWVHLEVQFTGMFDTPGVHGIVMNCRDVTERRAAELALQARADEMTSLHSVIQRVSASLSTEEVVRAALDGIVAAANPELAMMFLHEIDGELHLAGVHATRPEFAHANTPKHHVGQCLCGLAAATGESIYSTNIHLDPRCTWEECKKAGLRSVAALPVQSGGRILGVIAIATGTQERDFSKQQGFLDALAGEIAIGLQNALYVEAIKRNAEEQASINEELQQREAELSAIFRAAPAGIGVMSNRVFQKVNDGICRMTGYAMEELLHKSARILYASDEEYEFVGREKYGQIEKHGTGTIETTWVRKDGVAIHMLLSSTPIDPSDFSAGVVFTALDITERKRAQEALRASERNYREIFNCSNDAIVVHDMATGAVVDVNQTMCEMFGYSYEEALRVLVQDLSQGEPPYSQAEAARWIQRAVEEGPQIFEWLCRKRGGELFWAEITLSRATIGGEERIIAVDRDITQRKRAEEELRHLRNYLSYIIDSMPSSLIGVDSDGTITQWNSEAQRTTGLSVEDAVGQPLAQGVPRLAAEMERVREAMRTREVRSESRLVRKEDGETRYEDVTVYPLIGNGVEGAVIRIDDATERVRLEELMVQTEKMMSVGGLAAGMAHEINNPLGGILQGAQNIQRRVSLDLEKNRQTAHECGTTLEAIRSYLQQREVLEFLDGIRECGSRAARIVSNMLQFSRRSDAARTTASLPELIDRTIDLAANDYDLKKKYDFRHIEIIREFDPELPAIPVIVTEIEQVLLNLMKNAAQAMCGRTDGAPPRLTLRAARDGDRVRLEIEDNGPGMDETTRRRAFEPFFTTKEVGAGTGLGLSVSYMIITSNHNGTLTVESAPGGGCRFVIELPTDASAVGLVAAQ